VTAVVVSFNTGLSLCLQRKTKATWKFRNVFSD